MKVAGIIAEYNPFHNGHLYQIEYIKKHLQVDKIIVVLSGDFVQRGEPAIMDKYLRTRIALQNQVDLVVELPFRYATESAEFFANGAVDLLNQMGVVDYLCFGMETTKLSLLQECAKILLEEPAAYKLVLKEQLKKGLSFPAARQKALEQYGIEESIVFLPNNILALQYLMALMHSKSLIQPVGIPRVTADYHENQIKDVIASATAIRTFMCNQNELPMDTLSRNGMQDLKNNWKICYPIVYKDFEAMLFSRLFETKWTNSFQEYLHVNEELASHLSKISFSQFTIENYLAKAKTKQYTYTRLSRLMLHILFGIKRDSYQGYPEHLNHYIRVLGFKKDSSELLKVLRTKCELPVIQRLAKAPSLLNEQTSKMLLEDVKAHELYELIVEQRFGKSYISEYETGIVLI